MTKHEFLRRLEAGLATVPADERVAALQYYTEYFDDAGPEREAAVIQEIGSPEQLAADIRAESGAPEPAPTSANSPLYVGEVPAAPQPPSLPVPVRNSENEEAYREGQKAAQNMRRTSFTGGEGGGSYQQARDTHSQNTGGYTAPFGAGFGDGVNTLIRVLLIVAAVMFAPAMFGVFISIAVICAVPLIIGFALAASGVFVGISSLTLLPVTLGNSLLVLGAGIFLLGLGLLIFSGGIKIITRGVPAIWHGIRMAWNAIRNFGKGEVQQHG